MSDQNSKSRFSIRAGVRLLLGRAVDVTKEIGKRAWGKLWLSGGLVIAVVGMAAVLSIVMAWQFKPSLSSLTAAKILEQLDAGNFELARTMADELRLQTDLPPEEIGTPPYVLGVVLAREAEGEWRRKERSGLRALAIGYLKEARARGYPLGRAAEADLLLGKLHFANGQFPQSLPPLMEALAALPEQASPIHRILADACLRSADPDWQKAQSHLETLVKDPELTVELRGRAELDLSRVYFELAKLAECDAVLSEVREDTAVYPEALMLRGRLFMREADEIMLDFPLAATVPPVALEKYAEANTIFGQLVAKIAEGNDLVRQARYLRAICQLRQGKEAEAEQQLVTLRRGNFSTSEGLASALAIAELRQAQGRDEEAVAMFRSVISQAVEMAPYENRWIPFTQFRGRLEEAYRQFVDEKQFENALVIAKGLAPIVLPKHSVELSAAVERDWARQLELQASKVPASDQVQLMLQARATWIRAGRLYEHLAHLRFSTRQFPEDVWNSAECYFKGDEYQRTARLLKLYMENETRRKQPPALTLLGEAQLALGNPEEALNWLTECIRFFPKDPHSYRARIMAAKANQELGNLDASKQLLTENLEHEGLTPRSPEWRESKFELGRVLHQEGVKYEAKSRLKGVKDPNASQRREELQELELARDAFQLSIVQLEEAVQRDDLAGRDPLAKETLEARYFIAESHRQSAKFARRKLPTATIETTRMTLNREMKRELNAAADAYFDLQLMLNRKQEQSELTALESRLLRNCYFARADAMYDLEKFPEARKAYSTATNRYQHEPESLEAYLQIANCHRRENRPDDARGTLELAKVVLERIGADADFNKTTRYNRDEWIVLLDWLTAL
ncbi:MAG TPA: tetratricopeptide repeat protein [Pirellulaceae bacterium]|nr:tetratricopeptide repeat protein [Pirellulaceae bacterium]